MNIDAFFDNANAELSQFETTKPPKRGREKDKDKEGEFNASAWLQKRVENLFLRCSISKKIIKADTGEELSEEEAKTILLTLQAEQPIRSETFWNYMGSSLIIEKNFLLEYLQSCKTSRCVLGDYFDCLELSTQANAPVLKAIFRKWLIGTVAQICEKQFFPNVICPVLIGAIDKGKTSFFKKLTFATEIEKYGTVQRLTRGFDKDTQSTFCNYILICADDLDNSDFKKTSAFRTLISTSTFSFRPPFARNYVSRERIASICGTTNERDIIADPQNNRRIVPIEIEKIDFELLNSITAQEIWASAIDAYNLGETWQLNPEEVAFMQQVSAKFSPTTGVTEFISLFIEPCENTKIGKSTAEFMTSSLLYAKIIVPNPELSKHCSLDSFQKSLREMGFLNTTKRVDGKVTRGYLFNNL